MPSKPSSEPQPPASSTTLASPKESLQPAGKSSPAQVGTTSDPPTEEAMEEKAGQLSISLNRADGFADLVITDNGCGISEENISRLFEPYFTQKRNGMGLGLAFTLNTLQAHKANIDVASKPGKGTSFTITFPAV